MNYDNFGSLFANRRKEKGYTQKSVAEVLHTTDKSISRWETNKSLPDMEMMNIIAEVLDIPIHQLLKYKIKEDDASYEIIINELKNKNKKLKSRFKLSILLAIIFSLFVFLFLFFATTFNKLRVYNVYLDGNEIQSSVGIYIDTYYENVLQLGHIYLGNTPIDEGSINIYAKDGKKRINVVQNESLSFNNQMILNKQLGDLVNYNYLDSLYLELIVNDQTYTAKLNFVKRFTNNQFINGRSNFEGNEYGLEKSNSEIIEILEDLGFEKKDDNTYVNEKNYQYFINSKILLYEIINNGICNKCSYNFNTKVFDCMIFLSKDDNLTVISKYSYNFDDKKLDCKIGYCNDYKKVVNDFKPYIKALT